MAKVSTNLKTKNETTLNTTGILQLDGELKIETEDFGVLSLSQLLESFAGKLVKVTVKETHEDELDIA